MKKRLDTRFPAARIKKIMQADEDVGKIAMAVPLLMSKALELFLQDLCDRTYEITLKRGAKTMNSLHLKHCIQTFNVFDFLKEVVREVPDMGSSGTVGEDRGVVKRRRVVNDGQIDSDDESKRSHWHDTGHTNGAGRGRGRGRGRPRGRGGRTAERDANTLQEKYEDNTFTAEQDRNEDLDKLYKEDALEDSKEKLQTDRSVDTPVRNFDLNVGLDENGDSNAILPSAPMNPSDSRHELKHEEYPGWSLSEVEKMAFDPMQLARLNSRIDDDEDYDEEG